MTLHTRWISLTLCAMAALIGAAATARGGEVVELPSPPQDIVDMANAITWRYYYGHDKSAHTNGAHSCGRTFTLAVAARAGNTSADYRFFRQIRWNLQGGQCIVAAGGYGSQHERIFTGAAALIKHTPRLWNQLTADEQHKMDLLMKAALVASAWTTSDAGNAGGQNPDMMGGTNLGRGWNPNFREGMIGMMIVGTIYFGGGDAAHAILDNYDHAAFTAELNVAGLTNTYITFNYRNDHPTSGAPTAAQIESQIANYRYQGRSLHDLMEIYWLLTTFTYGRNVNTGLNNGAGIRVGTVYYGRMVSGQDGLPNAGQLGMLHELDGSDASGRRSSITYAYDGYRPNLINQIVMLTTGYWEPGAMADQCVAQMRVGIEDLFYKLDHGYLNYSNGGTSGPTYMTDEGRDFYMTKSLWYDVVALHHDGLLTTTAKAGPDRTIDDTELAGVVTVELDGSASNAAPGMSLVAYVWRIGETILGTDPVISVPLEVGEHVITLEVFDNGGGSSSDTVTITVQPPALLAIAGPDQTLVDADGVGLAIVYLDGSASFARDTTIVNYIWTDADGGLLGMGATVVTVLPTGEHTVTLRVIDSAGAEDTDTVVITVLTRVPGDANGDGMVDLDDFVILKQNFGKTDATWADGDFNGDGVVDLDDFVILKQNFGR